MQHLDRKPSPSYTVIKPFHIGKWLAMAFVLASALIGWTQDQQYLDIALDIEITSFSTFPPDLGKTNVFRSYPVRCIIGEDKWQIEIDYTASTREIYQWDGTNVIKRIKVLKNVPLPPGPSPFAHTRPMTTSDPYVQIKITPGQHPLDDYGVNVPWLAYCSGYYLAKTNRIIPVAACSIRHTLDSFGYADKTKCFDDKLGLPKSVQLFSSRELLLSSPRDHRLLRSLDTAAIRAAPVVKISDGLLKAGYVVENSTNIHGWNLPLKFNYFENEIHDDNTVIKLTQAVGRVSSIKSGMAPESLMPTNALYSVVDLRFRSSKKMVDGVAYLWTNAQLPPFTDAAPKLAFEKHVARAPADPVAFSRQYSLALIALAVLGPLFAIIYSRRKKSTTPIQDKSHEKIQ